MRINKLLKKIDKYIIGKSRNLLKRRYILFYVHNIMNLIMVFPLYTILRKKDQNRIYFTSPNVDIINLMTDKYFNLDFFWSNFINHKKAKFFNWDVVITADYNLPWFYRYTTFVQIFHGVAAKKTPNVPDYRFHHSIKKFDLLFFQNSLYREIAISKGLTCEEKAYVTGMPILDEIYSFRKNKKQQLKIRSRYIPSYKSHKIIMWAPTYSPVNVTSWTYHEEILKILSQLDDVLLIIKPHPNIFKTESRYVFESKIKSIFNRENFLLCYSNPYPFILLTDIYIGDFSSLSLEYTILRKPLILFYVDEHKRRIADIQQIELLKNASFVYSHPARLKELILNIPSLSQKQLKAMKQIKDVYFSNLGNATQVAISVLKDKKLVY